MTHDSRGSRCSGAGVPYLLLADLLHDQDVGSIRSDTCCHLNAVGHAAEALAPGVRRLLVR